MHITVLEGRSLAPKDKSGLSDPYVKVQLGEQKKVTKAIPQTLDPTWGETFYLYGRWHAHSPRLITSAASRIAEPGKAEIILDVFDWDQFSADGTTSDKAVCFACLMLMHSLLPLQILWVER